MKQWKGFVTGVCFTLLAFALVATAGAKTGKIMRELTYRDIRVSLDGEVLDLRNAIGEPVEPFMFDGTNYLPVRALAEALGLEVSWNGAEVMVVLTTPEAEPEAPEKWEVSEVPENAEPTPTPIPEPEPISRDLPEAWAASYPMDKIPTNMPVYVTPTGKHWHFSGSCNGGTYKLATYAVALKRGLTPCEKCVLTSS